MNITDIIKERKSVRSFNKDPLSPKYESILTEAINNTIDPFSGKVTIRLETFDNKKEFKPSTYGMIKGATSFFLLGIGNDESSALSAGFRFEQVVLKACEIGLGTCWIAATFKGTDFDRNQTWPEGEELKIVCPVGIPAPKRILERLGRAALGSNKRKPFGQLFFKNDFKESVSPESHFGESLEMLRLAPSSTNSQPWRALVDEETVHFYYKPKSKASVLDCGIGFCHFFLTERFLGHEGGFFKSDKTPMPPEDWIYLYSYKRE